jgi:tRNA threonylcarbamoyladenosine biosynthesis protein TsaB
LKLLAVETSTDACSAALFVDGELKERFELAPKQHTLKILPMIDALMAEAELVPNQLDALALSRGPGSFTGVRIATGVVHGIAFGLDIPVIPISTLAAIAEPFFQKNPVDYAFTALDARMGEIFWGIYRNQHAQGVELLGIESVGVAQDVIIPDEVTQGVGIGSAWNVYRNELSDVLDDQLLDIQPDYWPRAAAVARLGVLGYDRYEAVPVELALPVYLRDKVAKKESER